MMKIVLLTTLILVFTTSTMAASKTIYCRLLTYEDISQEESPVILDQKFQIKPEQSEEDKTTYVGVYDGAVDIKGHHLKIHVDAEEYCYESRSEKACKNGVIFGSIKKGKLQSYTQDTREIYMGVEITEDLLFTLHCVRF